MKRKILIALLGLMMLSQLPFAYRCYRLSRLQKAIQQLAAQRVQQDESEYVDYRGVIHVHSSLGGHSTGSFAELISAARANQLDFVIMTEHPQSDFDTSAMTLSGVHAGVLFINGNEITTRDSDRLLLIPGVADAASASSKSTAEVVDGQRANGGLSFVAYPGGSQTWSTSQVDGVETYNLFTNARQYNSLITFFDSLWSYRSYPDLMFANFFARPSENLKRWDEEMNIGRKLVAIAGNDAHSNVGLSLNDASGKQWLGVKLDPYERSFRVVRTHALIKKDRGLTRESLLEAIAQGHCYISFDLFGDAKGFSFATSQTGKNLMGDETFQANGTQLRATAPFTSRFVLFRNGVVAAEKSGLEVEFLVNEEGNYRVEVYLDSLPAPARGQLWIISNPIRLVPWRPAI